MASPSGTSKERSRICRSSLGSNPKRPTPGGDKRGRKHPRQRSIVETRLGLAKKEIGVVTVHADAPNARVRVDGQAVADLKEPLCLLPGHHVIDAEADGRTAAQQTIDLKKGYSIDANLVLPPAANPPQTDPTNERSVVPGVVGGVLGLVGVGLGIGLLSAAGGKGSNADADASGSRRRLQTTCAHGLRIEQR